MTTSNTYNTFTLNLQELVKLSLQQLTVVPTGGQVNPEDYELGAKVFMAMICAWEADDLHLWRREKSVLFITPGTDCYVLGGSNSDRLADLDSYIKTEISTAGTASDTELVVDNTTGMIAGSSIGIVLTDGTVQWTTIDTVDNSTTLTLIDPLEDDVEVDAHVYYYSVATPSIIELSQVMVRQADGHELELRLLSRDSYNRISNKLIKSQPQQYYPDKQRDYTNLYVYGTGSTANEVLIIDHRRSFQDFISSTNTPDFPRQWYEPLYSNLSVRLAPFYEKEDKVVNGTLIASLASQGLKKMKEFDKENSEWSVEVRR